MEDIINKQLEAYKLKDAKGMMQYFHPKIEMFLLNENKLTDSGLNEVEAKYEKFFEKSPNIKFELVNRMKFKNYIIDQEKLFGFLNKEDHVDAIVIYQIEDRLIRRVWIGI